MKVLEISARYARALFELADENKVLDETLAQLKEVEVACEHSKLLVFLNNPSISDSEKETLLGLAFKKNQNSLVRRLLNMLIQRGRVEILLPLVHDFEILVNQKKGAVEATVVSARPITDKILSRIKESLEKKLKKKISLKTEENASLIGGVQIRIGNQLIDGSVRTQLQEIGANIQTVKVY